MKILIIILMSINLFACGCMDTSSANKGAIKTNDKFHIKDMEGANIVNKVIEQSNMILKFENTIFQKLDKIIITDVSSDLLLKNIIHIENKKNFIGIYDE